MIENSDSNGDSQVASVDILIGSSDVPSLEPADIHIVVKGSCIDYLWSLLSLLCHKCHGFSF